LTWKRTWETPINVVLIMELARVIVDFVPSE
jgi:hypothetical protein